jgi:tripartite-type tricarboxylate transporter receptor subunit TctC
VQGPTVSVFRAPFIRTTNFDPARDFTYIIGVSGYTFGLVVRGDAPWKTFREYLADAKANPGKITYATPGAGTTPQITMELIAKRLAIQLVPIPFKGNADALNALLGGHVNAQVDSTGWAPQVNAGQLRLLVTWGEARTTSWPDVPTLKENGIDMVVNSPYGIAGPKGMDPKIVKVLHDAFKKGMDDPSFRATLAKLDQEPWYLNSDDYRAYALRELAEQKRIVEELGLKPE